MSVLISLTPDVVASVALAAYKKFVDQTGTIPARMWISWKGWNLLSECKEADTFVDYSEAGIPSFNGIPISIDAAMLDDLIYFLGE